MPNFAATIPTITDLRNLDTTNINDNTPVFLRELNKWYYLAKTSTKTPDALNLISASPNGNWKAINVSEAIIDSVNNSPTNAPPKIGQILLSLSSMRLFIATGAANVSDWKEIPVRGVNYGSGNPTTLTIAPRFQGDFFVDNAQNRLYLSADGINWNNIPITDGSTNVSIDPNIINSTPEFTGILVVLNNPERIYLSTGTTSTSDWLLLKTNQIEYDDSNTTPQNVPNKTNDVLFIQQTGKIYVATGNSAIEDWAEFVSFSFDVLTSDPASSTVRKFSYNSVKKQLWINDGTNTTLISDIKNKNNHLFLDVENYSEYSNFVDIDGDIGIQIYWHPINIPYFYYDGTEIVYYNITQFADSPWTDTGGTSANDNRAMYVDNTEINNARTLNGGTGKIDLSSFIMNNGVGNYFFIPTILYEGDSTYKCIGNADNIINLGLEFTENEFEESNSILDFKYDSTEFNLTSVPPKVSTIKGAFSSYDLASSTYMETLSGGIKFLQISSFPVNSTIQLKPYELLTNYYNFYV